MKVELPRSYISLVHDVHLFADNPVDVIVDYKSYHDKGKRQFQINSVFLRAKGPAGAYSADITPVISSDVHQYIEQVMLPGLYY